MTQRVAVAHECGHAFHGHDWRFRHDKRRDELEADIYAANLLIESATVTEASRVYADPRSIARELNVPVSLLRLWVDQRSNLQLQ